MSEITVKKGSVSIKADRKDLFEVSETHEGVIFNFKGGLQVHLLDDTMPSHVKQVMSNSAARFEKGKLIFDLDNYKNPVRVDAT